MATRTPNPPSGLETIRQALSEVGLGALADWWWKRKKAGWSETQLWLEARRTRTYKTRFPGIDELRAAGQAIDERTWVEYERTATELFRSAGFPIGFYDQPADFAGYITGRVGLPELQARVDMAVDSAYQQPPEVRQQLAEWHNVTEGDLAAVFLDRQRALPLLRRRAQAAQIAGASTRTGFGAVSMGEAESLAELGVTADEAEERFGSLLEVRELLSPIEEGEETFTREDQLDFAFRGDAGQRQRFERQSRRRAGRFEEGGGFASGFAGLDTD